MFTKQRAALGAAILGASVPALAQVPAAAEAVFTDVATDFGTILGWGYGLLAVVTVGMIVLGLVRKVANRSGK